MLFRAVLLGLAASGTVVEGLEPRDPSRHCGAMVKRDPATFRGEALDARATTDEDDESVIEVDVYFHVVAASKTEKGGYISVRGQQPPPGTSSLCPTRTHTPGTHRGEKAN